jgi:hypothetical protein
LIAAGALYFAVMFGLGFLLAFPRIMLLEPRFGAAIAVGIEAVPMVAAMLVVAPWAARAGGVPPRPAPRLVMGLTALLLLLAAETALDLLFRGRLLWAERMHAADGLIGYVLLAAFALMPLARR